MLGARAKTPGACLVVCAGTATTVDWLDAAGNFRGGLILPGLRLMCAALARNTAQLPDAEGEYRGEPRNTMDAIVSGCLHAQAGAIERMFARVSAEGEALCLLTGGAAYRIAPCLGIPFRTEEMLVLDGLLRTEDRT
jgi:type III pantothenate kinase